MKATLHQKEIKQMPMSLCDYPIRTDQMDHDWNYRVVFTIDCDYEELVDAIGLDFVRRGTDLKVSCYTDSQTELESWLEPEYDKFCENVLNPELAESCSFATVYRKKCLK
jgi:hypothetical protein